MHPSLRFVPVVLMGSLAVAYVVARPVLVGRIPYLAIFEFPVGAVVIALLLWAALARREPRRPPAAWRKHAQVVRLMPDPAIERDRAAIERWLDSGEGAPEAADVIARAASTDGAVQARTRASLAQEFPLATSRRKRGSLLSKYIEGV